jgi:cyclopropane fatty-acyl-phospholipid synthase-like methyltransferase
VAGPTWALEDAALGSRILVVSELLCESVDLRAGERVLDVACGSGNAALAAARRFCRVVGVDVALKAEMVGLARRFDVSDDDTLVLRLDYLEAVVRKPVWL